MQTAGNGGSKLLIFVPEERPTAFKPAQMIGATADGYGL